jgi:hypothetical protein
MLARAAAAGTLAGLAGAAAMTVTARIEQAFTVGALRGVMAAAGLRGPWAATLFTPLRVSVDQTLENLTGVGAPPWTWPRDELVIDVVHKAVYALVTGAAADALTRPAPSSAVARRRGLGLRLRGFA